MLIYEFGFGVRNGGSSHWNPWCMGEVFLVVTLCTIGQDKIHLRLSPTSSVELPNGILSEMGCDYIC